MTMTVETCTATRLTFDAPYGEWQTSTSSLSPEDEKRWQCLDPIFIMGRQRTGTSIMWRALKYAGFLGFPEGHLWFDLVGSFARLRDPTYLENLRRDIYTLGSGRNLVLEKRFP